MHKLPWITEKNFNNPKIHYGFLGKNNLVTRCYYQSKRATLEEIKNARKIIMHKSGLDYKNLSILKQIHSDKVIIVNCPQLLGEEIEADAQITNKPNIILGILTADCVPVLFIDTEKMIIGAAHAGWKGAIGGVLENTLGMMKDMGAKNIHAIIGPCIHQKSYEVGLEFKEKFLEEDVKNSHFFIPSHRTNHFLFDLPAYVQLKLNKLDLSSIYNLNLDTLENKDKFYSFRRSTLAQETLDGENIAIIMIKNDYA